MVDEILQAQTYAVSSYFQRLYKSLEINIRLLFKEGGTGEAPSQMVQLPPQTTTSPHQFSERLLLLKYDPPTPSKLV